MVAICWVVAMTLAAALLLGGADYWIEILDPGLRMMATATLVGVAAWAAYQYGVLPSRHRPTEISIARRIEDRYPELEDRLASSLEFLQQSEEDPAAGSASLRRAVISETAVAIDPWPIEQVVDRRPLRQAAGWAALAMAGVVICTMLDANAVRTALARLVLPLGASEWPQENGPTLHDLPKIVSLALTVHPPAYTSLPSSLASEPLRVLSGTRIELAGSATEPLRSAHLQRQGSEPIQAVLRADESGNRRHGFYIGPEDWIATESGSYRLEIKSDQGLVSSREISLHVDLDPPPTISWRWPTGDLQVLPEAVLPLEVSVKDNRAIRRVELVYHRSDKNGQDANRVVMEEGASQASGEAKIFHYDWRLVSLNLSPGTQLTLHVTATDDRPGTGQTARPCRITILTADQLAARLAALQSQILRKLEEALASQRALRKNVRRLEGHLAGTSDQEDRGLLRALQSVEINQRSLRQRLTGTILEPSSEGVLAQIDRLLAELKRNHFESGSMATQMGALRIAMERLATGPLPDAERSLTAARKQAQAKAKRGDLIPSLAHAAEKQSEVIAVLEQLLEQLSENVDSRRLARQLADLRDDQLEHRQTARKKIGLEAMPLEPNELSRPQRANLQAASASQAALARRFEKLHRQMEQLAKKLASHDPQAARQVAKSLQQADQLGIRANMHQATDDLQKNRLGQAWQREQKIANDLQKMLHPLQNQPKKPATPGEPASAGGSPLSKKNPSTLSLAQIRRLRQLQNDLANRTSQQQPPKTKQELQQLAAEQGRLAELVLELLSRNNEDATPKN